MEYDLPNQTTRDLGGSSLWVYLDNWLIYLLIGLSLLILIYLLKRIILKRSLNSKYHEQTIFLIKVPKEKPSQAERGNETNYVMHLREQIARAETIFKAIGGLRAQRWYDNHAWLIGRNDHFSFEIVASQKLISFYAVAPKSMSRYLEQQIQAYYPEALLEEVPDYNIFSPHGQTVAGYMMTRRNFIFPLKTYNRMEADPQESLVNVLSKLGENESIAIQYVVRSALPGWHGQAKSIVSQVNRGKKLSEVLSTNWTSGMISFLGEMVTSAKPKAADEKKNKPDSPPSATEQETLKLIEEKNSKAGLDVNIRLVANANDKVRAKSYLNNLASAFSQYNYYEQGNVFSNKALSFNRFLQGRLIRDFIFRRFQPSISLLLNTEEMASLFHPPIPETETPNILWLYAKYAAAPSNLPDEGIILGKNIYREVVKEVKIKREDRRRHTYVIGKSGVGKSVLLASMAVQDITNGEGVCVIDPHGDLVKDIISRIPPERANDVILFSPADTERPLALNLLEFDARYPEQKTFVINEMIKIFDKLYDLKATGGPIFEQYMRNAMLLVMSHPDSGSTLMEIPKVLADPAFRKMKLEKCQDPTVVEFWRKEAEKAGGEAALANVVPYITSKLTSFISNDTMRPIIGQQKSSFNLRDIMDGKKILLVDLSKGLIGEMNAYLLGMILVGKILMSALSRTDMPQEKRVDFYLYIDEFQNFTTDSVNSILSEARKYNLNLIIAHQYLGQLVKNQDTSIKNAVFGNVGTWVVFKIGSEDAEVITKEFTPVFNQYDLINIDKYTAYVKLLINNSASRPFSMSTMWPLPGIEMPEMAAKIKSLSRLKYGQDRNVIEAKIMSRTKIAGDQ